MFNSHSHLHPETMDYSEYVLFHKNQVQLWSTDKNVLFDYIFQNCVMNPKPQRIDHGHDYFCTILVHLLNVSNNNSQLEEAIKSRFKEKYDLIIEFNVIINNNIGIGYHHPMFYIGNGKSKSCSVSNGQLIDFNFDPIIEEETNGIFKELSNLSVTTGLPYYTETELYYVPSSRKWSMDIHSYAILVRKLPALVKAKIDQLTQENDRQRAPSSTPFELSM